jgi:hypothetical protein
MTATPSRGIGRGGKRNPVGGRPKGAFSKKARLLIAEAETKDLLTPIAYMLEILRDPEVDRDTRLQAAGMAAPYLHARLSAIKVLATADNMTDMEMVAMVEAYEKQRAARPERVRIADADKEIQQLREEIRQLRHSQQGPLFRRLMETGEAELQRLAETKAEQPGYVRPRSNVRPHSNGHPPADAFPESSDEPVWVYDQVTKTLKPGS